MRRFVLVLPLLAIIVMPVSSQDAKDSAKAAAARKLLQTKLSVDYKDTLLQDVAKDLSDQVPGLKTKIDTVSGLSQNQKINYEGKNKTLAVILDEMCKKNDFGYVIISGSYKSGVKTYGAEFDGYLLIRKSAERGFPLKDK